jgi:hypothetical protein
VRVAFRPRTEPTRNSTAASVAAAALALLAALPVLAAERSIDFPTVDAALDALRKDADAQFETQGGWLVVATQERGNPVLWSFAPEGHPAYPAVVKRTALESKGNGYVQLDTLCGGPPDECERLLEEFRQFNQKLAQSALAKRIELDVGISLNDHTRVHVKRLLAEEGKAAEIRVDGFVKAVIVPSWDESRGVLLWTAVYEFDGQDFRLLARPEIAAPGIGSAEIRLPAASGDIFGFSITPLLAATGAASPL